MSEAPLAVLGAGTMGTGIAQVAALGGFETLLYDPEPGAVEDGLEKLGDDLEKGVERGRWSKDEAARAAARVRTSGELEEIAGSGLVIEAAPERLELKRELFAAVAAVCGPETVLASNTSSLRIADIAAGLPHPERVLGMHFFNPPALMRLVEVVATERSSAAALAIASRAAERMGRTPIRSRDTPGFVANRLARPYFLESLRMLEEDLADAATIDRAVRLGGGFRMGPFELIDLIGLDVNLAIARSIYEQGGGPARWRPSPIQERLVGVGRLGRKSGHGFYDYGPDGARPADPDLGFAGPTLEPLQLSRIGPAAATVVRRLTAQIANEAAFALEDGIATADHIDTAMRLGLNWPLGPLGFAELIGPGGALETLETLRAERGEAYEPAPLLRTAAERGVPLSRV